MPLPALRPRFLSCPPATANLLNLPLRQRRAPRRRSIHRRPAPFPRPFPARGPVRAAPLLAAWSAIRTAVAPPTAMRRPAPVVMAAALRRKNKEPHAHFPFIARFFALPRQHEEHQFVFNVMRSPETPKEVMRWT